MTKAVPLLKVIVNDNGSVFQDKLIQNAKLLEKACTLDKFHLG